ncbi:glycosyltransferase [Pseudomonas putida]|uniref:glycosyltransferase family 2 protein n=1 Tax=Pseudomonas putida TaxID=303 RepID=UPI000750DF91|nr:glycosyltransferase [Pseudomonas putida]MBH3390235.1 glycosyltransferase [Pseudomonas putida]
MSSELNIKSLEERRARLGAIGALDFLIDYQRKKQSGASYPINYIPFDTKAVAVDKDLSRFRKIPQNFPLAESLPPIQGLANDFSHLEDEIDPAPELNNVKVSIVILTYNRIDPLRRTLAGLSRQSYPSDLIEVIVTDDGSSEQTTDVIKEFSDHLDIKYVWHKDVGFTASAARNNGVNVARNDLVILLDVDMFPSKHLVRNYAKWWKTLDRTVLIGPRKYIDICNTPVSTILHDTNLEDSFKEIVTNNTVAGKIQGKHSVDWRLEIFERTNNLRTESVPFRTFASGNVAFSKKQFTQIGGFDERFNSWGFEDTELGYRFFNTGKYIVPVMDALAYHQEPEGGENETDRSAGKEISGELFGNICPYYRHLITNKKEFYSVPRVSIYIPAYNCADTICDAIHSALNQTFTDLEVCVCDDGSTDETPQILERYFSNNPRVRWVRQENGGIGKASNTALSLCRGIYVGQLDSDDYLARDVVEKCVAVLDKKPNTGLVYTTYENEYPDGRIEQGYNYPVFTREKMLTAMIAHHFRIFKKRYWHRTLGFNERVRNAVDYDMYLKLCEVSEAEHLNIIGYRRRLHGQNTSLVNFGEQMKNTAVVVNSSMSRLGIKLQASLESEKASRLVYQPTTDQSAKA